jgi:putative sigma-54 modulation protein
MRLELTGRHVDVTPVLRRLVERKLAKLERLLDHRALSAQVVLTQQRRALRADVTLHARGERFLHGAGEASAWEPALTSVIEKLTQQAQKVKGKAEGRKRDRIPALEPAEPSAPTARPPAGAAVRPPPTYRSTRQKVRDLSASEAVSQLDGGKSDLLVFRDPETAALSVLYRTRSGELVLVQTEA